MIRIASLVACCITSVLHGFAAAATWTGVYLAENEVAAFKIQHIKGSAEGDVEYERWNSFSRIDWRTRPKGEFTTRSRSRKRASATANTM